MVRLLSAATVLSLGTVTFLALAVPRLYTGYDERAIRTELQTAARNDALDEKARTALAEDDIDGAEQYVGLADELGNPVTPETRQALAEAQSTFATIVRGAGQFAGAYITGHADSAPALAGAIASDLTVVGDVRDIISEGGKAAVGKEYSEFLLALAGIGLLAEGATIATGGTSLAFKAAVSVLKVAKRTGNLTVDFSRQILRLARTAAQPARGGVEVASIGRVTSDAALAPGSAVGATAGIAARAELRTTLGAVGTAAGNAGPANAVRMMRLVRTTGDAKELATFTSRFGRRSRVVADLTGKATLRAFRTVLRGMRLLVAFLWSLFAWVAGLLALRMFRFVVRSFFQVFRGLFFSPAVR